MLSLGWAGSVAPTPGMELNGTVISNDNADLDFKPSLGVSVLGFHCISVMTQSSGFL